MFLFNSYSLFLFVNNNYPSLHSIRGLYHLSIFQPGIQFLTYPARKQRVS